MKRQSVINQYGRGDNNLPAKVCAWMNEHTYIIDEKGDEFIFGVSIKETTEYIKKLKGEDIKPEYIHSIRSKAMMLYREYNDECKIKWID